MGLNKTETTRDLIHHHTYLWLDSLSGPRPPLWGSSITLSRCNIVKFWERLYLSDLEDTFWKIKL